MGSPSLVERLRAVAEKQRVERGGYLDYGTPDPWLLEAAAHIETQAAALRLIEAAMMRSADGKVMDVGWNITLLNRARPAIRAALGQGEEGR